MAGVRKYKVTLTQQERDSLQQLVSAGKGAARKINHARILLLTDESDDRPQRTDADIAQTLHLGLRTIARVRQRFVEEGFEAALSPKPRPKEPSKLDKATCQHIIAIAISEPPAGQKRWTLRLIAERFVVLGWGEVSHESVRGVLKKMR